MNTFKLPGSKAYENIFGAFKSLNSNVPYLLYTSEDDSTALWSTVADCAEQWKRHGNTVSLNANSAAFEMSTSFRRQPA